MTRTPYHSINVFWDMYRQYTPTGLFFLPKPNQSLQSYEPTCRRNLTAGQNLIVNFTFSRFSVPPCISRLLPSNWEQFRNMDRHTDKMSEERTVTYTSSFQPGTWHALTPMWCTTEGRNLWRYYKRVETHLLQIYISTITGNPKQRSFRGLP
jgi:hypothetical protein